MTDELPFQYILYVRPELLPDQKAMTLVPQHAKIVIQNIHKLPKPWPAFLDGTPILAEPKRQRLFKRTEVFDRLQDYADVLSFCFPAPIPPPPKFHFPISSDSFSSSASTARLPSFQPQLPSQAPAPQLPQAPPPQAPPQAPIIAPPPGYAFPGIIPAISPAITSAAPIDVSALPMLPPDPQFPVKRRESTAILDTPTQSDAAPAPASSSSSSPTHRLQDSGPPAATAHASAAPKRFKYRTRPNFAPAS